MKKRKYYNQKILRNSVKFSNFYCYPESSAHKKYGYSAVKFDFQIQTKPFNNLLIRDYQIKFTLIRIINRRYQIHKLKFD